MEQKKKIKEPEPESSQEPEDAPLLESSEEDEENEEIVQDEPHANEPPVKDPPAKEPPVEDPPVKEPPAEEPPVEEPPAKEPLAEEPLAKEPHAFPEDWDNYSIDHIKYHKLVNNKIKYLIKWKWDCATRTEEADETLKT